MDLNSGKQHLNPTFALVALVYALASASALCIPASALANSQDQPDCEACVPAREGLNAMMNGDLDSAITAFRQIQSSDPQSPLGFLLEADATWWRIYLTTADLIDPDVFDVVDAKTSPYDSHFQDLINVGIRKAAARIRSRQNVPRNQLYEGLAYALRARYYGLRDNDLPTARAAKRMRALLLAAEAADPNLADADAGLGLYNYFVDTLPTIIKMLKFFIGLPGGSRELGLQQLEHAAQKGDLVRAEAKFYLAKNYSRPLEQQYAKSLQLFQELDMEFPYNPLWKLLSGTLEARLNRIQESEDLYREVLRDTENENSEIDGALHRAALKALQRLPEPAAK